MPSQTMGLIVRRRVCTYHRQYVHREPQRLARYVAIARSLALDLEPSGVLGAVKLSLSLEELEELEKPYVPQGIIGH